MKFKYRTLACIISLFTLSGCNNGFSGVDSNKSPISNAQSTQSSSSPQIIKANSTKGARGGISHEISIYYPSTDQVHNHIYRNVNIPERELRFSSCLKTNGPKEKATPIDCPWENK